MKIYVLKVQLYNDKETKGYYLNKADVSKDYKHLRERFDKWNVPAIVYYEEEELYEQSQYPLKAR